MTSPTWNHHREETLEQQLASLFAELEAASARSLGYLCNLAFDYEPLYRFLRLHVNHIGDPLGRSSDWERAKQADSVCLH